MKIIAHRGYWIKDDEKNSPVAFERALKNGFGIETDIRDRCGALVIAHDMPRESDYSFNDFIDLCCKEVAPQTLALNIKSDGLGPLIVKTMQERRMNNWFTFDMSLPELVRQLDAGMPAFTRISDFEPVPLLLERTPGVWVDTFRYDWKDFERLEIMLTLRKMVCIVSPELHGRSHLPFWENLRRSQIIHTDYLMLCTDFPRDAQEFFQ